jgi:hypothetical protein
LDLKKGPAQFWAKKGAEFTREIPPPEKGMGNAPPATRNKWEPQAFLVKAFNAVALLSRPCLNNFVDAPPPEPNGRKED